MNHAYRIVWNPALACWQAVAEIARSFGKSASGKPLLLALSLLAAPAWAGPQGGQVTAGSATIQQSGTTTTINQSSAKAAIDWSSFSVGKSEAVRFNQPSASAINLNRVTGSESSQILGSLTANGQVFILNPNGVLFGQGAQVNVGGLVASTRNMSNADFMAGNYQLTGSGTGSVVNQGTITVPEGGTIALIAPVVQNTGTLNALQGNVLLAAADAVTLKLQDGSLIGYTLDQGSLQALVDNGGIIQAAGGHVVLTAKGLDALSKATINHGGIIEAQTVSSNNGVVELLGDMATGEINLSGKIDASAPTGGNGGFVETSAAHVNLKDGQHVTTMSAMGKTGTWLIDPYDWIIAPSGGGATGTQISGMLENSDVTLRTTGVGINQINPQGDIVINDAISWNSGNTLSLIADRNVDINRSISGASLSVVAPGALTISGTGSVTMRQAIEYRTDNILLQGPSTATALGIAIYPFTTTRDVRIESNRTSNALSISPTEIRNFLHSSNIGAIGIGGSSSSLIVDAPLQGSDIDAMDLSLNGNAIILNAAVSLGNKGLSLINMTGGTTIVNAPISSDAYVTFVVGNSTASQTANGQISANIVMALGTGNVLLHGARNRIQNVSADVSGTFWVLNDDTPLVVSGTPWQNGIRAYNIGLYTGSGLTLNAPIVATGSGDVSVGTLSFVDPLCSGPCIRPHIELGVGQYFTNNVGASALTVPDGKFWSLVANSPSTTQLNGLVPGAVSYYTDSINGDVLLSANRVFYGNHDDDATDVPHTPTTESILAEQRRLAEVIRLQREAAQANAKLPKTTPNIADTSYSNDTLIENFFNGVIDTGRLIRDLPGLVLESDYLKGAVSVKEVYDKVKSNSQLFGNYGPAYALISVELDALSSVIDATQEKLKEASINVTGNLGEASGQIYRLDDFNELFGNPNLIQDIRSELKKENYVQSFSSGLQVVKNGIEIPNDLRAVYDKATSAYDFVSDLYENINKSLEIAVNPIISYFDNTSVRSIRTAMEDFAYQDFFYGKDPVNNLWGNFDKILVEVSRDNYSQSDITNILKRYTDSSPGFNETVATLLMTLKENSNSNNATFYKTGLDLFSSLKSTYEATKKIQNARSTLEKLGQTTQFNLNATDANVIADQNLMLLRVTTKIKDLENQGKYDDARSWQEALDKQVIVRPTSTMFGYRMESVEYANRGMMNSKHLF